ncbi:uncharacterized protein BO80DRAFT_80069 [Aspergillus ibericus CBS 121593]|uniref:Uncharacterized protein n=1 Tax=Aspergillus ibericus CBS 121593 TaxID=1448316 RepID=A0A395HDE2_9EURO|nr:hypothetical protein BO80DRAFT_80069 [Aspergillus ibericus CBS 121593]RAL05750.1 hypothetical protein BO80DRAFT_80069 [Aspergillus ibericus CBS 121593]
MHLQDPASLRAVVRTPRQKKIDSYLLVGSKLYAGPAEFNRARAGMHKVVPWAKAIWSTFMLTGVILMVLFLDSSLAVCSCRNEASRT